MTHHYDFDIKYTRRGTNSYKWDTNPDSSVIPLWVADMDFRTATPIIDALRKRVKRGIFGYTHVPEEYYTAITNWFSRKHNWNINPEWIIYTSGVVPAISAVIKALTKPGDAVAVLTPVYNCFYSSIRNNECSVARIPLMLVNNRHEINFSLVESTFARPDVSFFLLCNPHNPGGRVWTRNELHRLAIIAKKHDVIIISDEIHCELTYPGKIYTPLGSLIETLPQQIRPHMVICNSPSKSFNIAGLQIANIIAPDLDLRNNINHAININEVCDVNPFGVDALIAAYNKSEDWLEEVKEYLYQNYLTVKDFLATDATLNPDGEPLLTLIEAESTYLAWINCHKLKLSSHDIDQILQSEGHIQISPGTIFGPEGEGYIRLNFACPRMVLKKALRSLRILAKYRK